MSIKSSNAKKFIFALVFLIVSLSIEYYLNINLSKFYPNLTVLPDFLFEHTPYVNILWLADAMLLLANVSFLIFIFSEKRLKEFPFYAVLIGIYSLIRGLLICATPIANPAPNPIGINLSLLARGGMFPSGHIGTIFFFFICTRKQIKKMENFLHDTTYY